MTELQTVIPTGVDPTKFHQAQYMRSLAEEGIDPGAYERAARAFKAAGMPAAAAGCRARAEHYLTPIPLGVEPE